MKMGKSGAFIFTMLIMAIFSAVALWWPERSGNIIGILTAFGSMGTFYIGLQVANNGVMGKTWNNDMYHHMKGEEPEHEEQKKVTAKKASGKNK